MGNHARTGILRGIELRYVLTTHLATRGSATVAELADALDASGYRLTGRGSKVVSDALRWEIGRGRVVRTGRGRYALGRIPRQTLARMRTRVSGLEAAVAQRRAGSGAGVGAGASGDAIVARRRAASGTRAAAPDRAA